MEKRPSQDGLSRRRLLIGGLTASGLATGCLTTPTETPDGTETATVTQTAEAGQHLYVAPDGDGDGSKDSPFGSIVEARDHLREQSLENIDGDVIVHLEAGTYRVSEPITFTPEDSGTDSSRIRYVSGGRPATTILDGGVEITEWEAAEAVGDRTIGSDEAVYKADVSDLDTFYTLYENGIRADKARHPNREHSPAETTLRTQYFKTEKVPGNRYPRDVFKYGEDSWSNSQLDHIESAPKPQLLIWSGGENDWFTDEVEITGVNRDDQLVNLDMPTRYPTYGNWQENFGRSRYFIQNVPEFLDQAGEYWLDEEAGTLYYWPREGEPEDQQIVAPQAEQIIKLVGEQDGDSVSNLTFDGLALRHTDFASYYVDPAYDREDIAQPDRPAIQLTNAENITIQNCLVTAIGFTGINLGDGSLTGASASTSPSGVGNVVRNCEVSHTGLDGVKPGGEDTVIENTYIHHCGELVGDGQGTNMGGTNTQISNCSMHRISKRAVGWSGTDSRMRHTKIWRTNEETGDIGALYSFKLNNGRDDGHGGVNTVEQTTIDTIFHAADSEDIDPNGIFMDGGTKGQIHRNMHISRTDGPQWRGNGTNKSEHTIENCSFGESFDPSGLEYADIGVSDESPFADNVPGHLPAPTGLSVSLDGDTVTLEWDQTMYADTYTIYRAPDPTTATPVDTADQIDGVYDSLGDGYETVASDVTETSYEEPREDTDYFYSVRAVGDGTESYAPRPTSIAVAPTGLSGRRVDGTVELSWDASTTASTYTVYRSTTAGGNFEAITESLEETTYTDSDIDEDTDYYYVVTAVTSGGAESAFSNRKSALSGFGTYTTPRTPADFSINQDGSFQIASTTASSTSPGEGNQENSPHHYSTIYTVDGLPEQATVEVQVDNVSVDGYWSTAGIFVANDLRYCYPKQIADYPPEAEGKGDGGLVVSTRPHQDWQALGSFHFWIDEDEEAGPDYNSADQWNTGSSSWPCRLRLEKNGTEFTAYYKNEGSEWTKIGTRSVEDADAIQDVGIYAHETNEGQTTTADFQDFTVTEGN